MSMLKPPILSADLIKKLKAGTVKDTTKQAVVSSEKASTLTEKTLPEVMDALRARRMVGNLSEYELTMANIAKALSSHSNPAIQSSIKELKAWLDELATANTSNLSFSSRTR